MKESKAAKLKRQRETAEKVCRLRCEFIMFEWRVETMQQELLKLANYAAKLKENIHEVVVATRENNPPTI